MKYLSLRTNSLNINLLSNNFQGQIWICFSLQLQPYLQAISHRNSSTLNGFVFPICQIRVYIFVDKVIVSRHLGWYLPSSFGSCQCLREHIDKCGLSICVWFTDSWGATQFVDWFAWLPGSRINLSQHGLKNKLERCPRK